MSLLPRTLLVRTFLLISLLIFVTVATWLSLFALAEREPRARQLAQLTVSVRTSRAPRWFRPIRSNATACCATCRSARAFVSTRQKQAIS